MDNNSDSRSTRRIVRTAAWTTILPVLLASSVWAGPTVRVRLASGRVLQAEAAARTDEQRLWLVYRTSTASLWRGIDWDRIAAADFDGRTLTAAQLKDALLNAAPLRLTAQSDAPDNGDIAPPPAAAELLPTPPPAADFSPPAAGHGLHRLFAPPRIASAQFDAHLANWNASPEADGLILHVRPLDAVGHVVPIRGTLEVELHGPRRVAFHEAPQRRGRRMDRLGRWTRQVLPGDIHAAGVWFKLPFQADHPEFDTDLGHSGLVHVRLVVPGEGVFEASLDGVRIRAFSPLRDDLERVEGRRFLANERTSRGKRTQD